MKVVEINLPESTASRLEHAAERLNLSPEELLILSIEEKLAQLDKDERMHLITFSLRMPTLYRRLS